MSEMNKRLNYFTAIQFLGKYIKAYRKNFIMFYVGWMIDSLLTLIIPILFGVMIDEIVYYQNVNTFFKLAFVFLVCVLFSVGMYFGIYAQHSYLMGMFTFSIRRDVFAHMQKCDAQTMANISSGELMTIMLNYPGECMHFIIRNIIHYVNCILMIVLYSAYLLKIEWHIGCVAILTGILSVVMNTIFKRKIRNLSDKEREQYGKCSGWIYEILGAIRDIRLLGAKNRVDILFEDKQRKLFTTGRKAELFDLHAKKLLGLFNLLVKLTIYTLAAITIVQGNMTLGIFTVVMKLYEKLTKYIENFSYYYLDAQMRISYIQKVYDFLHTPTEKEGKNNLQIIEGDICLKNISFGYEDREYLLENISLHITPGERVAIVGKSGCGKTTLAQMLVGFYQPQAGKIEIDGQCLAECNLKSIRKNIGFVQQDVLVFDGTIKQNLLLGKKKASEEELITACKKAGLYDFVLTLEKGLDTVIGSTGLGLSGGQKQRIAIARIYLRNPAIIIFDEATSALDQETEWAIQDFWDKALEGKTTIIITHRQSSVMLCNRVFILEDKRIVEEGSPALLAAKSSKFRTLFAINGGV